MMGLIKQMRTLRSFLDEKAPLVQEKGYGLAAQFEKEERSGELSICAQIYPLDKSEDPISPDLLEGMKEEIFNPTSYESFPIKVEYTSERLNKGNKGCIGSSGDS